MAAPRGHRLGLLGAGIAGSLSPMLHTDEAAALGVEPFSYTLIDLEQTGQDPARSGEVMRAAIADGYTGLNVTHPCKQAVIDHLDALDPHAERLGAVNTVVVGPHGLVGHNTDYSGFGAALDRQLSAVPRSTVVLAGAGGAGAAVAQALVDGGARELLIVDPDLERAGQLAASVEAGRQGIAAYGVTPREGAVLLAQADGLVNASPLGMQGHPGTPISLDALESRHWVADIVYRPLETELLSTAVARGCHTMDGIAMLVGQAADAFALMTGITPDVERMHAAVRAHLARPSPMTRPPR